MTSGMFFLKVCAYPGAVMWYFLFSGLSLFISITLLLYTWSHRHVKESRIFSYVLLCIISLIVFQAGELLSDDAGTMTIFANLYYLPIQFAPVLFLLLSLQITNNPFLQNRKLLKGLMFFIPILTQAVLWTNDFHLLMRRDVTVDTSGVFVLMSKTYGPGFWAAAIYNFLLTFIALAVLAAAMRTKNFLYRTQAALLFFGLLLPVISMVLTVFGILRIGFDITPAVLGLSGLFAAWGIFRFRLFDAVPVAHSAVISGINSGVMVFDAYDHIVDINPAAETLIDGYHQNMLGTHAEILLSFHPPLLELYRRKSEHPSEISMSCTGQQRWYEVTVRPLYSARSEILGTLIVLHDITDRKRTEEAVRKMSLHDPLTGLPNRRFFMELAERELNQSRRHNTGIGTAFIDLDDLKIINDTWGHEFGDTYLKETADRLKEALRDSDTVCRLGGDEFALLLPGLKTYHDLEIIARKVFRAFSRRVSKKKQVKSIRASMGLSAFPEDGDTIEELLKKADEAMYTSKRSGKNRYTLSQTIDNKVLHGK